MQVFIRTLLLGIASGSVYALASIGLVLTYKTSGVLNFGYGALALFTTFIYWQFSDQWHVSPWLAALIVVAVVSPLIGFFLDTQLFRRIEGQPQIIGVIATVGLFVLLEGLVLLIWGGATRSVKSLFPAGSVHLPGGTIIGKDSFGILTVAIVSAGALGAMLRYTKIGVAFRAVVSNRPVAGLMAINTGLVSGLAWAMSTAFAALTGILLTPGLLLDPNFLPPFIIAFVLGAAVVGYLRSLPLAYAGGLIIGITQAIFIQYIRSQGFLSRIADALPFILITVAVLAAPRAIRQSGIGASFIVRTREVAEQATRAARGMVGVVIFGLLALLPLILSGSWQAFMTQGLIYAVIYLSLVILTGYSGQISLGHTAFMGIAAFSAAHLVRDANIPMWGALPLGALAAVPAGALIGFISVRVHGLYLALMTLAFAFMANSLFFTNTSVSGGEGGIPVPRPAGVTNDTAFFYLVLVVLLLCALLAANLRTGRTGRVLAGLRDSETACRSLGIPVMKYKILIFGLSAFIAGLGGILFSMILEQASSRSEVVIPFYSLFYTTIAVVGGIFHVGGAVAGGLLFGIFRRLADNFSFLNRIQFILFGLGATLALAQNPEGLFGELRRGGAAVMRLFDRMRRGGSARPEPAPVAGGQE